MSKIPPLQRLRAFEAAVRLGSFTDAAEELGLTQGAISQHARALEATLGYPLFERASQGVVPTGRARALAVQVRQGLSVLERAFSKSEEGALHSRETGRSSPTSASLVVSAIPSFAMRWLSPRLAGFYALYPGIELDIRPSTELAQMNSSDGVDFAIRYGPGSWPGLQAEKLLDEWIFPAASPDYLAGRSLVTPSDLTHSTLLRHSAQPWEPWLQAAGVELTEPKLGPKFSDAGLLIDAALSGQGVALVRRSLVQPELRSGRLIRLWDVRINDIYSYYCVWRATHPRSESIRLFRQWLQDEAAEYTRTQPL
jgi:DNA-binding transcriptional LysR family regulator